MYILYLSGFGVILIWRGAVAASKHNNLELEWRYFNLVN